MIGRLIFFDDVEDCDSRISMNTYYGLITVGGVDTFYKNTIYLPEFEFQRSGFETNIFEEVDNLGVVRQIARTSIERISVDVVIHRNLLSLYNSLPSYDNILLEVFDNPPFNETTLYRLERIEFTDNTDPRIITGTITLTFDLKPEVKTGCCTEDLQVLSDFLAYWDTNDSGSENIDSDAEFQVGSLGGEFWAWQLYFESDGITPLTGGNAKLEVIGVRENNDTFSLGEFNGGFGDLLSDSGNWTTDYNIFDYFGAANNIGHGNIVRFAKKDFAIEQNFVGGDNINNAIKIEFYLSINDSPQEKCTLPEIYSVLTSFGNHVGNSIDSDIEYKAIGLPDQPSTLTSYAETRTALATSTPSNFNAFTLDSVNSFSKTYDISVPPPQESYSVINATVASGLSLVQRKSTRLVSSLSVGADFALAVSHIERPASFPVNDPTFYYVVYYDGGLGTFPFSGAPNPSGVWYLNGVSQGFIDTSVGNHSQTVSSLPVNEDINTVKIETSTSGGSIPNLEISIEFQYKLFRFY